ncbi:hypothetical protein [Nonomuraea jabiensis]|uniref:hypothetical protein n=1 Tax=Nonomuraea jabiensis TaxID=882448 RepID=UPI003D70F804
MCSYKHDICAQDNTERLSPTPLALLVLDGMHGDGTLWTCDLTTGERVARPLDL